MTKSEKITHILKVRAILADTDSMNVKPSQFDLLSRCLDAANLRQAVIAHNIANVNTPNFKRLEVAFEQILEETRGNPRQAAQAMPRIVEAKGGATRADGNNVDLDGEIGRLSKNTLLTSAYTQVLSSRIATMRAAISGR